MPILSNQQVTLVSGQETLLKQVRFGRLRVTITGIAGEFTTIPMRTRTRGGLKDTGLVEATEATVRFFEAIPFADVHATTPEGVASLDIIFEVRTRADF